MLPFGLAVGVAVAVVLCVGVMVLLIILGMRRYGVALPSITPRPAPSGPGGEERQEMEWDNTELNITVNPLEGECTYEEEECEEFAPRKTILDCDDVTAYNSDREEGEKEQEKSKCTDVKELEWDDSTLSY